MILRKRSRQWNDPLVEFYRQTHWSKRLKNSAHLYLAFHHKEVPHRELIHLIRDEEVYKAVGEDIYNPRIEGVIESTALERFVEPVSGLEMLVDAIFGYGYYRRRPWDIVEPILVDRLHEEYQKDERLSLNRVCRDVEKFLIGKIKCGGLAITLKKARLIYEALERLTEKQKAIISLRFGLDDGKTRTLKEVSEMYEVSQETIRQIEIKALRRLRHPRTSGKLRILTGLATDEDLDSYLAELR